MLLVDCCKSLVACSASFASYQISEVKPHSAYLNVVRTLYLTCLLRQLADCRQKW